MAIGQQPRRNEAATMYAEYGARVKLDERYQYPTNGGTIVASCDYWDDAGDEYETVWTVLRDFDGQECNYVPEQFTVTLAPFIQGEALLQRWGIDECFAAMEDIVAVHSPKFERYQSALISALYTLHVQEEGRAALDPDKYSHDEDWGADDVSGGWESGTCDDGYGYPVYRVED